MINLSEISCSLQSGKAMETSALITKAFAENYSVESILKQGLIPGIKTMEERLVRNEILLPEMLIAARAMNMGLKALRLLIPTPLGDSGPAVIIGTAKGEVRDIEKNLIVVMLEGLGFRVLDLGNRVAPEKFVQTAITEEARFIIAISTLPTTMPQLKLIVQTAAAANIREQVKIVVTGKPVTEKFCQAIGADIYAPDAASAAELVAARYVKDGPAAKPV
ncbi:MAG: cobalamin-dependent protein [Spirochaetaceae bacterium]|jgi:methanogenic corrinoid protein MtbC1|nr:cobalamin-dependent protein [Spirochaetaceae bacterium]